MEATLNIVLLMPLIRKRGRWELAWQRKDGSLFPVEISLSPNWIGGSLHVIASVRDITERKLVEDRIQVLREQYTAELTAKNEQLEARNL